MNAETGRTGRSLSFLAISLFAAASLLGGSLEGPATETWAKVPLSFEANRGQTDARVTYLSRGPGYTLFLTHDESVLAVRGGGVVRMRLVGARSGGPFEALDEQPGKSNYFVGNDPASWRTDVPLFARVAHRGVYDGIDVVYHGRQGRLEYDFLVAPGADPARIALGFGGVSRVSRNAAGELVLTTDAGALVEKAPEAWQEVDGARVSVPVRFAVTGRVARFRVGAYDRARPLVIDPVLLYSSYIGGTVDDSASGIAVDSSGNAYLSGQTNSTNFPHPGGFQGASGGGLDAFVAKVNASGNGLVYATYLGGSQDDFASGVGVDGSGRAVVVGSTFSTNFPTQSAFQPAQGGVATKDAFVTMLNASGNGLVYSSYLGGGAQDDAFGVRVDGSGNAYVVGQTQSVTGFPIQAAVQAQYGGGNTEGFFTKVSPSGTLVNSTYIGGNNDDAVKAVTVDGSGTIYLTGTTNSTNFPVMNPYQPNFGGGPIDGFVMHLNAAGNTILYSTYLGGPNDDQGTGIGVDANGNAYVTGTTQGNGFPLMGAYQGTYGGGPNDGFVTKLNPSGVVVASTFLGGDQIDVGKGIAVDSTGNVFVTGRTTSTNFPMGSPFQATLGGGQDVFVAKLNSSLNILVYGSYLGGSGDDIGTGIAIDGSGNAYVSGSTLSSNFPTAAPFQGSNAGGTDGFVAKVGLSGVTVSQVSPTSGPATGGTSVTVTGTGFTTPSTVLFGGTPATNVSVQTGTTISCTTPAHASGTVDVAVQNSNGTGSLPNSFTFTTSGNLTLSSIAPTSGSVSGGTFVTITGTGFQGGASVSFGGVGGVMVSVINPTTITATTPQHSAGAVNVVVTNPGGATAALSNGFTYVANSSPCSTSGAVLCVNSFRFRITSTFRNPYDTSKTGFGTAAQVTPDTGYFWFFNASNVELIVKILDGRSVNGKFWVLYGALSDVEYQINITDTQTGVVKTYYNAPQHLGGITDIVAF